MASERTGKQGLCFQKFSVFQTTIVLGPPQLPVPAHLLPHPPQDGHPGGDANVARGLYLGGSTADVPFLPIPSSNILLFVLRRRRQRHPQ